MESTGAAGPTTPSATSEGEEWTSSERVPMAGTDEPGMGDDITASGPMPVLSDAQIAGITDVVHSSQIEQAQLAQSKSKDPHVLGFAAMMLNSHTQAKQREQALGVSPAASPMLQTLSTEGQQTMATLKAKSGQEFNRAYLQAQIEQNQKVLQAIDRQLLPSAKSPELRSHLQGMKPTVEQHLEAARDAQRAMNAPHPTGSPR